MAYSLGHVIDGQWQIKWGETNHPDFNNPAWLFRIKKIDKKPLLKEPQYLYAYFDYKKLAINWSITGGNTGQGDYIGKIKIEEIK